MSKLFIRTLYPMSSSLYLQWTEVDRLVALCSIGIEISEFNPNDQ